MARPRKLITLTVGALVIAGGLLAFVFVAQRNILFPRHLVPTVPDVPAGVEGREVLRLGLDGALLQDGGPPAGRGGVEAWLLPGEGLRADIDSRSALPLHALAVKVDGWNVAEVACPLSSGLSLLEDVAR